MNKLKTLALATAVSAGLLGAGGVLAAVNGTVGETSTGKFDIRLNKDAKVAIWGMRDLPFTKDDTKTLNACVYSTTGNVQFQLSTTADEFILRNGDPKVNDPAFTVSVTDDQKTTLWGAAGLSSGDTSTENFSVVGAIAEPTNSNGIISKACTGDDQTIDISVAVTGTSSAGEGAYSNEVTLVVSPI